MRHVLSPAGLALCLLAVPLAAQQPSAVPAPQALHLKYATFDPLAGQPAIPALLRADADVHLWIVQFRGTPTDAHRAAVAATGAALHGYLPHDAYVARMDLATAARVRALPGVRWLGQYHPAYRLDPALAHDAVLGAAAPLRHFTSVVVDKHHDKPALIAKVSAIGGRVVHEQDGSILFEVELDGPQLQQYLRFDEVLWVEAWTAPEEDMDNARQQGGADYVESVAGYTGTGIIGHVYEGVEASHPDFTHTPSAVLSCASAQTHGHCTAGIVYGNGTSHSSARGMASDASFFYTNYSCVNSGVSRWQVVQELVTNRDVMLTTASWGGGRTRSYTAVSADTDDIIFDHGIVWTQSQSNAGNQDSRPEAWAKNIFSIGGVAHGNNADRRDDSWSRGGASTGPAADGRIKPDLCAYYDNIWTSDRVSGGYSSGSHYTSFGGTSGATPIVSGHNALAIQMFTDFIFNNSPRVPGGSRFQNRPKSTTLKAIMIANARQYSFTSTSSDNRREHQGWGFPDLKQLYDNRGRQLIVDETVVLQQNQSANFPYVVQAGDPELKVAMTFADPAANPASTQAAVNDLSLRVTSPSGLVYWGNQGLTAGNYSQSGGSANTVDTVECVFISAPEVGTWQIEVLATRVAQDSHVETGTVDADFALCAAPGVPTGVIGRIGTGCTGTGQLPAHCAGVNTNGGTFANSSGTWEYAYDGSTSTPLTVTAIEIYTGSRTGTAVGVNARIYGAAGSAPSTTPLAIAVMTVGATPGFYRATFAAPVNLPAGAFWVSLDHSAQTTYLSNLTGGTAAGGYYRSAGSGSWSRSGVINFASFRVICSGGGGGNAVPDLALNGSPTLGSPISAVLSQAAPNSAAVLFSGLSDSVWSAGALPFSLAGLGAPGCVLHVSDEALLPFTTSGAGNATATYTLAVNPSLLGLQLYHQYLVIDPGANTLGVAMSNGARILFGD